MSESQDKKVKSKKRKSLATSDSLAAPSAPASSSPVRPSKSTGSSNSITVEVASSSNTIGPVFANFPSVKPAKKTPFTLYSRNEPGEESLSLSDRSTVLAGETEDIEYFSTNRDLHFVQNRGEGSDCQYIAALYDPSTKKLHVHPSSPLYLITHIAKRMKLAEPSDEIVAQQRVEWRERRNDLGEAFGTRKAKKQIQAEAREKVDVRAMESVKNHLSTSIGMREEVVGPIKPSELIPVPNMKTDVVEDVFPRNSIIPDNEFSSIDLTQLIQARDDRGRMSVLPYRRSRLVEDKMRAVLSGPSNKRKLHLRLLYYIACLMGFLELAPKLSKMKTQDILAKLPGIPKPVLDGLLARFAESSNGKSFTITESSRTKILAWICTCHLATDNWSTDVGRLAKDLSLKPAKVADMFKQLGCKLEATSAAERAALGSSAADAQEKRRAVLKAPVEFPKPKSRGPVKR